MARISPVSLTGNGELKTTRVSEAELRDRLEASRNHIAKRVAHARRASGRCGPARSAGRRPGGGGMGGPRCGRPQRGEGAAASPFQKLRGVVEGAIKFVLAKRCDHGGMRWIKERVQAVAQLRCIVVNGDWKAFERFVHERQRLAAVLNAAPSRIQQPQADELRHAARGRT